MSLTCFSALQTEKILTPSGFEVEIQYRALEPGEMITLAVKDNPLIKEAQVWFMTKKYFLNKSEKDGDLRAFIGLELSLEPGSYPMDIFVRKKTGEWEHVRKQVPVSAKEFPLKKFWVNERFLKPPEKYKERIRIEADIIRVILGMTTDRWLGEGEFILPSSGKVNSYFGERRIFNDDSLSSHGGIDIKDPYGTPVRASNSGRVVLASNFYFAGKMVLIDHGLGIFTFYCHFSKIRVKRGEEVKKGKIIGEVGATGRVTGAHLHWGVIVSGTRVDPFSLLSFPFRF